LSPKNKGKFGLPPPLEHEVSQVNGGWVINLQLYNGNHPLIEDAIEKIIAEEGFSFSPSAAIALSPGDVTVNWWYPDETKRTRNYDPGSNRVESITISLDRTKIKSKEEAQSVNVQFSYSYVIPDMVKKSLKIDQEKTAERLSNFWQKNIGESLEVNGKYKWFNSKNLLARQISNVVYDVNEVQVEKTEVASFDNSGNLSISIAF
jgi:hypothetical protein